MEQKLQIQWQKFCPDHIPGSKKIYPFYIQASTKADTVEVYEAPIDAMSGATLRQYKHDSPWRSVHYLALGGLNHQR